MNTPKASNETNKVAFFDLDMTVYAGFSMADFFFKNIIPFGRATQEQAIQAQNLMHKFTQGELSYKDVTIQSVQLSAEILQHTTVAEVKRWQENFFTTDKFFPYVEPLFKYLKDNKFTIYIVSGSIEPIVSVNAHLLGVTGLYSELEIKNGQYSGRILSILNYTTKEEAIAEIFESLEGKIFSIAVGDSSGDMDMLQKVTHGFLFEPREAGLKQQALEAGVTIVDSGSIIESITQTLV